MLDNNIDIDKYLDEKYEEFAESPYFHVDNLEYDQINAETNLTKLDGKWKYVQKLSLLGEYTRDWNSLRSGSLFVKSVTSKLRQYARFTTRSPRGSMALEIAYDFDSIFTMKGQNISLPNLVHLYSILNIDILTPSLPIETDDEIDAILKFAQLEPGVFKCIEDITDATTAKPEDETEDFFKETLESFQEENIHSPCLEVGLDTTSYCQRYCKLHEKFFNTIENEEFLSIMKYSLPQAKLLQKESSKIEKKLAEDLFGKEHVGNVQHSITPTAMPIYCLNKKTGFQGDDLETQDTKVCNEFKLAPSDQGLVLSSNLNTKELMNLEEVYDTIFDPVTENDQPNKITGGNHWSEIAFIISTDGDNRLVHTSNNKRKDSTNNVPRLDEVVLQLHQSEEIALVNTEASFDKAIVPLKLKKGHEYHIDVTPIGQTSSEDFKAMSKDQRGCNLKQEGLEGSLFTVYTQKNCKYECYVKIAREKCKCHPWDFFTIEEALPECDIFGRTCFMRTMERLAESPEVPCQHCVKECDYVEFKKVIAKEIEIASSDPYGGKYFQTFMSQGIGSKPFIDYLLDENGTYYDQGLKNAAQISTDDSLRIYKGMIVIFVRFLNPRINEITPKYTVGDMIGNFGGQFGLFEQVTGASFLGILNLMILLFKLMFSLFRRE